MSPSRLTHPPSWPAQLLLYWPQVVLTLLRRGATRESRLNAVAAILTLLSLGALAIAAGLYRRAPDPVIDAAVEAIGPVEPEMPVVAPKPRKARLAGLLQGQQRTPPPQPPPQVEIAEMRNLFELRGVLSGDAPRAIVWHKASGTIHYLSLGEHIDEFEVVGIGSDSVTLRYMGQEFEVTL